MIKKFDKYYLTDVLCLPWDSEYVEEDKIIEIGRWEIYHLLVFRDIDGTYWETDYWHGTTEMQPERPWEYEDEVECRQVERKITPIIKFFPIEEKIKEPTNKEKEMIKKYFDSISMSSAMELYDYLSIKIGDDLK